MCSLTPHTHSFEKCLFKSLDPPKIVVNTTQLHKKWNWNFAICSNMNGLEGIMLVKIHEPKDKYCMISLLWNLKKYSKLVNITEKKLAFYRYRLPVGRRKRKEEGNTEWGLEVQTISKKKKKAVNVLYKNRNIVIDHMMTIKMAYNLLSCGHINK